MEKCNLLVERLRNSYINITRSSRRTQDPPNTTAIGRKIGFRVNYTTRETVDVVLRMVTNSDIFSTLVQYLKLLAGNSTSQCSGPISGVDRLFSYKTVK